MKNKLTQEEQALNNKLNEAEFAYQESHWAEMQQMIGKKGFLANYGTFFKAAIAFVAIVSSVVLINNFYPEDKSSITTITDQDTKKDRTKQNEVEQNVTNNEDQLKVEETIEPEKTELTDKGVTPTIKAEKSLVKENDINKISKDETPKQINESEKTIKNNSVEPLENTAPSIELSKIEIKGSLCLDNTAQFITKLKGNFKENIDLKWFLNNKRISGDQLTNSLQLMESGANNIAIEAYYNGNMIAAAEESFEVENKVALDFVATDLTDPFYDQNVNLRSTREDLDNLMWFENKNERVQFGHETAWTFINEGTHNITLQHTSDKGCVSSVTKPVSMQKDFIPAAANTFTPDEDGINETFKVDAFTLLDNIKFQMQIINMRSEVVFQTNDPNEGWNGRLNNKGSLLSKTTYAWQVQIENKNGRKKVYDGKVRMRDL